MESIDYQDETEVSPTEWQRWEYRNERHDNNLEHPNERRDDDLDSNSAMMEATPSPFRNSRVVMTPTATPQPKRGCNAPNFFQGPRRQSDGEGMTRTMTMMVRE